MQKKAANKNNSLEDSFNALGFTLQKNSKLHHDYKSFATMGLEKFKKLSKGNEKPKSKAKKF